MPSFTGEFTGVLLGNPVTFTSCGNATTSAEKIKLHTICYDGDLYLSVADSPWKKISASPNFHDLASTYEEAPLTEDSVRDSDEPLRSALLLRAAEAGVGWMKFDERMDILTHNALVRLQEFISYSPLGRLPPFFSNVLGYRLHPIEAPEGGGGSGGLWGSHHLTLGYYTSLTGSVSIDAPLTDESRL